MGPTKARGPGEALMAVLDTPDVEAALAVRQRVKDATPRQKSVYLGQVSQALAARRSTPAAARQSGAGAERGLGLVVGSLKILGYLEDPAAIPILVAFARDARQPLSVRKEAIVAPRFTAAREGGGARP